MENTPPPIGVAPLQYQSPMGYEPGGATRHGMLIVTPTKAVLPPLCVKCGQAGDDSPITKTYYWHHPLLALMIIFPGLLIYALVAICVRKKAVLTFSLCPEHRRKSQKAALVTAAVIIAAVVLFVLSAMAGTRNGTFLIFLLPGIAVLLGGIVYGVVNVPPLKPARITASAAQYKGAGVPFLEQL